LCYKSIKFCVLCFKIRIELDLKVSAASFNPPKIQKDVLLTRNSTIFSEADLVKKRPSDFRVRDDSPDDDWHRQILDFFRNVENELSAKHRWRIFDDNDAESDVIVIPKIIDWPSARVVKIIDEEDKYD